MALLTVFSMYYVLTASHVFWYNSFIAYDDTVVSVA